MGRPLERGASAARSDREGLMRVLATPTCCATLILAIGSCGVAAEPLQTLGGSQSGDRRDVERFLAKWFQLEERQAYPEIYSRLSRRFKADLRKEENVRTAAGYARLR